MASKTNQIQLQNTKYNKSSTLNKNNQGIILIMEEKWKEFRIRPNCQGHQSSPKHKLQIEHNIYDKNFMELEV